MFYRKYFRYMPSVDSRELIPALDDTILHGVDGENDSGWRSALVD